MQYAAPALTHSFPGPWNTLVDELFNPSDALWSWGIHAWIRNIRLI